MQNRLRIFIPFFSILAVTAVLWLASCASSSRGSGIGRPVIGKITSEVGQSLALVPVTIDQFDQNESLLDSTTVLTSEDGSYESILSKEVINLLTIRVESSPGNEAVLRLEDPPVEFSELRADLVVDRATNSVIDSSVEFVNEPTPTEEAPTPIITATNIPATRTPRPAGQPARATRTPVEPNIPTPTSVAEEEEEPVAAISTPTPSPTPEVEVTETPTSPPSQPVALRSCRAHWENGEQSDGVYLVDPDGPEGPTSPIEAYCDMGGQWMLVLNYLHRGGTLPSIRSRDRSLPIQSSTQLGGDESSSDAWGHARPELIALFQPSELRFYCQSSGGDNYRGPIHFATTFSDCLNYAQTGQGTCQGVENSFRPLSGHYSTGIPETSDPDENSRNEGSNALLDHTFVQGNNDRTSSPDWI